MVYRLNTLLNNSFYWNVCYPVVLSVLTTSTFTPQTQYLLANITCYINSSDICFDLIYRCAYILLDKPDDDGVEVCIVTVNATGFIQYLINKLHNQ